MADQALGRFTSGQAWEKFLAAYERAFAALWPTPWQELDVETSYGATHVHRYGPARGEPVVLLHGELRSIKTPALLLVGEHSPLLRPAAALARVSLIAGAQAEIVRRTGHGPAFERPGHANPRITAFIATTAKNPAG